MFYDCPLETLYLGRNLSYNTDSYYGYSPFYNKSTLTSVTIGNSVTSIVSGAFYGCTGLKTVINLSNLTFSKGSTNNGYVAYYADKVYNVPNGSKEDDFIFGKQNDVNTLLYYLGNAKELTLPADCKGEYYVIGANVFENNTTISSIVIPNSVTSIERYAFYGCYGLTSVTIGNSVTSIRYNAFRDCNGLKEVHISDLAAWFNIDFYEGSDNPLYYANNLYLNGELVTELVIPEGVKEIKKYAFYGCTGLTSVTIPNSVTSIGSSAFYNCKGLTSIVIPNSVTTIGNYAFYGCSGLTSVTIPNSVTSIGNGAFYGCSGLTSVTIPNSVTSIGNGAFFGCSRLTSVTIGNSVTSIRDNAFKSCTGLKTVINLSNLTFTKGSTDNGYVAYYANVLVNAPGAESVTVTIEGDYAFTVYGDVNTLVAYNGKATELTLPADYNGETYIIAAELFKNNSNIKSVTIPESVTEIGDYAFSGCIGLTSVVIPNSVTKIGNYAFYCGYGLESVVIGSGVASIGESAFESCNALTSMQSFISAENLFAPGDYAFYDVDKDACTLYVPKGAKDTYASTTGWDEFVNIEEVDFSGIEDVKAENGNVGVFYDLQGRKVDTPSKGFYIVNGKKVVIK